MRRFVLAMILLSGLVLGLALALAVNGRMAHLRALDGALPGGAALPGWSAAIDDSAGLMRGNAQLALGEVSWRLQGIGRAGPVWRLRLDGPGLALQAPAVLARPGAGEGGPVLVLGPVAGHVENHVENAGPAAGGGALPGWPEGRLDPLRGGLRLDLRHGRVTALEIEGLARDVVFEGSALGSGRFTMTLAQGGEQGADWRLAATLSDAAAENGAALDAELRIDRAAGVAALALLPQADGQMPGDLPSEGVLRALPLPSQVQLPAEPGVGE